MNILFAFLGAVMFLDCVLLVFLILLQLPKKDAGAGMAFGGAATDALFGAGSGNALTTITRYSATVFFAAALAMAWIGSHRIKPTDDQLEKRLTSPGLAAPGNSRFFSSGAGGMNFPSTTNAEMATTNAVPTPAPAPTQPAPAPAPAATTNK